MRLRALLKGLPKVRKAWTCLKDVLCNTNQPAPEQSESSRDESRAVGVGAFGPGIERKERPVRTDEDLGYSLFNRPWVKLVEDCTELYSDITDRLPCYDPGQLDLAHHVLDRLLEILERNGVTIISGDQLFDRTRHAPEGGSRDVPVDSPILATISPGFAIGRRVLRKAVVKVDISGQSLHDSEEGQGVFS